MCGITGVFAFNLVGKFNMINLAAATAKLEKRGPDAQGLYSDNFVGLGHRRLSVIDTSPEANQPMWDDTQRYAIIFNGEIFNYKELRKELQSKGILFRTQSDTEVLLHLFILEKEKCLNKLNGFFSFCIYDKTDQSFFLARDRYGVKPLLYLFDEDKFLFASQMRSILEFGIEKKLDYQSLYTYLQLNYIPAPDTIFTNVKKLLPGNYMIVIRGKCEVQKFYTIPYRENEIQKIPYEEATKKFSQLLEESVQHRLISDVPIGSFLSGGLDSSIIATLAKKHKPDLRTFSIGYKDEKFFDETEYARLVAGHIKTDHTIFDLSNDDLFNHLHDHLNALDEPFGDSSSLPVYILSKETKKYATVALSGDGADELLGGYTKHAAFLRMMNPGWKEKTVTALGPLWKILPNSRHTTITNKFRQLNRFATGSKLSSEERYWSWAGYASENEAKNLFHPIADNLSLSGFRERKKEWIKSAHNNSINLVLLTDMQFVLPNDMLTKVDMMSMAHGLEVRTPFLDYRLVDFAFSLPADYKITNNLQKRIAQDAFRSILPSKLYNRPKKGFEVPLLKWFRKELRSMIVDDLLSEKFIHHQGIFNYEEIQKLKHKLFSLNPGDVHARIWGLIVFQWWWKKYMEKK